MYICVCVCVRVYVCVCVCREKQNDKITLKKKMSWTCSVSHFDMSSISSVDVDMNGDLLLLSKFCILFGVVCYYHSTQHYQKKWRCSNAGIELVCIHTRTFVHVNREERNRERNRERKRERERERERCRGNENERVKS